MLLWQIPTELLQDIPSGWADEPHEKLLWGLVSLMAMLLTAIVPYIGKQFMDRRSYTRELKIGAATLSNPRSDREFNGRSLNSATMLNYVIEDQRDQRKEIRDLAERLARCEHKLDVLLSKGGEG